MDDSFLIGETTMNISDLIEIILALGGGGEKGWGLFHLCFFLNSDNQKKCY